MSLTNQWRDSWHFTWLLLQERDQLIQEEIVRLEKLQRLAEKIHQEAKMTDSKLDDIEAWIEDEVDNYIYFVI